MVQVDLITGFLGAGKTTFIHKYLRYLKDKGLNVRMIENEFGAVSVDTMLLRDDDCDITDLAGLCMCCVGKDAFIKMLIESANSGCDRIIVEPSGIYDVDEFFEVMSLPKVNSLCEIGSILTIADPYGMDHLTDEAEYLLYAALTSVLGCAVGFAVGFRLFPWAVYSAYSMMYTLPQVLLPVRWNIIAWVAPVTVGSILLAAFWACFDEFRACPAILMRPKAPKEGRRIWLERIPFLWKRFSFSHKVTARNLFRYKKRLVMTLLGVAGCTSLLLTGFGLRDSICDIVELQFGDIYRYELTVVTDGERDDTLDAFFADDSLISGVMPYCSEDGKVRFGGNSEATTLCIPETPAQFHEFVRLRERKSGNAIPFPDTGVILTEKLCETLGISIGDTVTLEDPDGHRGELTVAGITENYLTSFAYLSPEAYRLAFGREPDLSTVLCRFAEGADADSAVARALESPHAVYASSSRTLRETFADSIGSINGVIWVLILAAGLLSMVVLYSLTNVNILERRKELATITVLGFHDREVERYIFRETNVLSFLGSLLGLGVGVVLHRYVVRTVEVEQVMFGRVVRPLSYLYAVAISMVFTLLVNQLLRRRIRRIDMVEAMKAGE